MAKSSNNYLTYGLMVLIFGLLVLLSRTGVLKLVPYGSSLVTTGSFFIIAGVIFLLTKSEKTLGAIFTITGILLNADIFFGWIKGYSGLIMPIILLVMGIVMIIRSK